MSGKIKRKLETKTLIEKCNILREIEKGMTNKEASEKYGVPRNTISTWKKKSEKLFNSLEKSSHTIKKLRGCDYEEVDQALYKWFVLQRSQNVPIDGALLKEKAMQFAETFDSKSFKASEGWLDKWKKR